MTKKRMRQTAVMSSLVLVVAAVSASMTTASTSTQVDLGLQVYQQHCITCHGANLEGGQGPALVSEDYIQRWGDLHSQRAFIHQRMPPGPRILTHEQAVNVAAFIQSRNGIEPNGFAYPDFHTLWTRTDQPVAASQVQRSWLWGPEGFHVAWEEYQEADGGTRLVQYFDKTRMEITRIDNPRDEAGFVTNGLLAKELVTGNLQTGDAAFEQRASAAVNVAGDPDDAQGPTYATFSGLTGRVDERPAAVIETIDRAGNVGQNGALGNYTDYVYYVPETGHNIPRVFWDFLNSSGPVQRDGQLESGRIFEPWYAPVGFPITEAYWARVQVGGQTRDVLVQVFERRVLTYTPENAPEWQVEMGNVGRHYHAWRYGQ